VIAGDFDGDGKDDLGGFYDYGSSTTRLWLWRGTQAGLAAPTVIWDSGANNWNLPQSRFVTGDFNGDGKADVGGLYDYGGSRTKLWVWHGTTSGLAPAVVEWDSGPNNWNLPQSRFLAADFNGDGKADIAGVYDYGASTTGIWVWSGTAGAIAAPVGRWNSGANNWSMPLSRFVAGDFNGDGKADLGAFYDYGGGLTRLWVWRGVAAGLSAPSITWDSGAGNWTASLSMPL
ncbi:MAG TPA: VCBS repeat-containing protein, partial [Kofleriaceae bacterium]|nr:VCBS repeat-containing protein [Kofleriaceae bacterium]